MRHVEEVRRAIAVQARRARLEGEARPLMEAAVRAFRERAAERCYFLLVGLDHRLADRVARLIRDLPTTEGT